MVASQWLVKTNEVPEVVEQKNEGCGVWSERDGRAACWWSGAWRRGMWCRRWCGRRRSSGIGGLTDVVEGSVFDAAAVRRTVAGADVVLSALGARSLRKEDVLERAVPLIVEAMRAEGVRRIVALGSAGALEDSLEKQPAWRQWFVQKIVYNTVLKWAVASQVDQWKVLSASGLDFTMVMPPMLTDGKARVESSGWMARRCRRAEGRLRGRTWRTL